MKRQTCEYVDSYSPSNTVMYLDKLVSLFEPQFPFL